MAEQRDKYVVDGVDMFLVRNRNEWRVAECMREILATRKGERIEEKALQDIYAYALNHLPARYAQRGTIVLREPVRKDVIAKAVRKAITAILKNPKD